MQKILIIRGGALGDFILTLPVIQTVIENFPSEQIDLIGCPPYLLLAKNYVSNIHPITDRTWLPIYVDSPLGRELKNYLQQFDLIISYIGNSEHTFNSHLKNLKGENFIHCNPYPKILKVHISEYLLASLTTLKIKEIHQPQIKLDERAKDYALKFWKEKRLHSKRVIAVHPGSGSTKKRWPVEKFVELANFLQEIEGTKVIFILGEAEYDLGSKLGRLSNRIMIISDLNIINLASILEKCSLYIGNDSGVTHLAGALKVPTIALFGPTDPQQWGPKGEKVHIIYHKIYCSPCTKEERDACNYQRCLDTISTEEVEHLATKVFNR